MRRTIVCLALSILLAAELTAQEGGNSELRTEYQRVEIETVAEGLQHPWAIAHLSNGDLLVTERPGRLQRISGDSRTEVTGLPPIHAMAQGGLLDVVLHPDFEENGWVYLTFSEGGPEGTVASLARGRLSGTALEEVQVLFRSNQVTGPGRHYGSRILFLPDGTLLMSIGDRGAEPARAQDARDHSGSVVRLNADGTVPEDNPFVGSPEHAPEIFSYGHRNIQGLARHPETGAIWATEHGPRGGDELNLLEPGANYGWPTVSRGREYPNQRQVGQGRSLEGMTDPVYEFLPTLAPSGLAVVQGGDFHPTWQGNLLAGGLASERLLRIVIEGGEVVHMEALIDGDVGRIRDVRWGPDGMIYLATDAPEGGIYRLRIPPEDESRMLPMLEADGRFTTFTSLLRASPFAQILTAEGPFTAFAPTDAAFEALPEGFMEELQAQPERLMQLLANHFAQGGLPLERLAEAEGATSGAGVPLRVERDEAGFRVQGVRVREADREVSNGLFHVVEEVLVPARPSDDG